MLFHKTGVLQGKRPYALFVKTKQAQAVLPGRAVRQGVRGALQNAVTLLRSGKKEPRRSTRPNPLFKKARLTRARLFPHSLPAFATSFVIFSQCNLAGNIQAHAHKCQNDADNKPCNLRRKRFDKQQNGNHNNQSEQSDDCAGQRQLVALRFFFPAFFPKFLQPWQSLQT